MGAHGVHQEPRGLIAHDAVVVFFNEVLMENRNGLIVNAVVTQADGRAERETAKAMVSDVRQATPEAQITLGADKGYVRRG